MSESDANPFQRKVMTRQPGLVGAQWWNEGLSAMGDPVTRRGALKALAFLGVGVTVAGGALSLVGGEDEEPEFLESHDALKIQRMLGWNFGATDDALSYSGPSKEPFKKEELSTLSTALAPRQDALKPYAQATLFQAVSNDDLKAMPGSARSLRDALRPLSTPGMEEAFQQGLALAHLFDEQEEAALATAVLVDLPGHESVAFAAALARRFEPVFTFDNWPHPLGVVPAHLTLAAVAHHQSLLTRLATERRVPAPPVFVLDRQRLAPYTDESTQFDNRYVARMPSAAQLRKLGLQHVLYVHPGGSESTQELDDLNEDFVLWREAGLDVKLVAASDFRRDPSEPWTEHAGAPDAGTLDAGTAVSAPSHHHYFGGSPAAHHAFWAVYPWGRPLGLSGAGRGLAAAGILSTQDLTRVPSNLSGGYAYEPLRRSTMFSSMPRGASAPPRSMPLGFGKVSMRVSSRSRAMLGPAFTSRSSWSRASSSSGG